MMTGSITISVFCPICKADIYFAITGDFNEFPVPFQYKHGRPVHNAILTLDKNFQIVDAQFKPLTRRGRPTKAAIDDFMNTLKTQSPADVGKALAKLLTELPAVYDPNLETSEERYQFYGYDLAEKCSTVLDGENDLGLITTMQNVFESSKIGKMSNIKNEGVNTFFEISNPIQNAKVPDGGKCFFVFMKSFFHKLYQQKFQKSYLLRSDWDITNKTGKFQLICQWNEWAEKLKKRMAAKKK